MPTTTGNTSETSVKWTDYIDEGIGLLTTGIGAVSASTTDCGKQCRAKCKEETGAFFSGRNKCKKACKADCIAKSNASPQRAPSPIPLIIMGAIILVVIGLILWWMFKKKK